MASTPRACSCCRTRRRSATFHGPSAGVEGAWRFVNRVWDEFDGQPAPSDGPSAEGTTEKALALRRATHRAIKSVTEAIEGFRFNSGIARLYEFLSALRLGRRRWRP